VKVRLGLIKESVKYLLESWQFILAITALFFFGAVLGFVFSSNLSFLDKVIQELIEKTSGLEGLPLTLFILFNNLSSAFYGILLGVFLGIMPVFSSFGNGLLLGYVSSKVIGAGGGFFELVTLVPHGVFELPAIFIALGLGLKLGMGLWRRIFSRQFWKKRTRIAIYFLILVLINHLFLKTLPIVFALSFAILSFSLFLIFEIYFEIHFEMPFWKTISRRIVLSFIAFLIVVMPLLVVAAIIEGSFISLNSGEYSVCFEKNCFSVELAISDQEKMLGLSGRASLENGTGMLFLFNESGRYNFWMKDMNFPLDIIWFNETKNIVYVWESALPCVEECIEVSSNVPAKYVLEIPSGSFKELGLEIGEGAEFSSSSKHLKLSNTE